MFEEMCGIKAMDVNQLPQNPGRAGSPCTNPSGMDKGETIDGHIRQPQTLPA